MIKTFLHSEKNLADYETFADFLLEAFQMVYDIDPTESIMVLKITDPSGNYLRLTVDGDLFWVFYLYNKDGELLDSFQRQGILGMDKILFVPFLKQLSSILHQYPYQPIHSPKSTSLLKSAFSGKNIE